MARIPLRLHLLSALPLLVAGCGDASHGLPKVPERDVRPTPVTSRVLQDGSFLRSPDRVAVVGSRLVVLDESSTAHVLRAADGKHLASVGRKGDGPGEFHSPNAVEPDPQDPASFWIYDMQHARSTRFTLAGAEGSAVQSSGTLQLQTNVLVFQPVWINGSMLVASGLFEDGRLALFTRGGLKIRPVGQLLLDDARQVPAQVWQHAHMGRLTASLQRGRIAMATRHADELAFYSDKGDLIQRVRGSHGYEPRYEVRRLKGVPYMTSGDDLRFGYIDLASTDHHVYALFSGRTREEAPGRANYAHYVQVFDWDGRLVRTFELDASVISIAVDRSGEQLFAIRHHPSPALLRIGIGGPGASQTVRRVAIQH
ncbi:MAG: TolB-like 6-bladed beta-propeller domain-containing protein [Chloroflexota bacterium]|nr:TolB-like 6-bladed beta-propeller domain-containing protein [Chloroflexota bacterium]